MRLAYVTNNASRTPQAVAEHLTHLGVPAEAEDVITSAQAVARLIADQVPAGAKVLAVGGEGLFEALRERGLTPVESAEDGPAAAVQGYGPELRWSQLAEMAYAVNRGCAVVRVQHRPDHSQRARDRARERRGRRGGADRHRRYAAGGRQAAAADAPGDGAQDGGAAAAGGRRPARHGHRGGVRRWGRLAAGPHRGDHARSSCSPRSRGTGRRMWLRICGGCSWRSPP